MALPNRTIEEETYLLLPKADEQCVEHAKRRGIASAALVALCFASGVAYSSTSAASALNTKTTTLEASSAAASNVPTTCTRGCTLATRWELGSWATLSAAAPNVPTTLEVSSATCSGYVMTDSNIYSARDAWLEDPKEAEERFGHISDWCTGEVTDMSYLFCSIETSVTPRCSAAAASFNDDIGMWNTSGVTTMRNMFWIASAFNQPIGEWRVDEVTDMRDMFGAAESFNQPLGGWSVDKVTDMEWMFIDASSFNQPLNGWNVAQVTTMESMFSHAGSFNQNLGWCVDADVDLRSAFDRTACTEPSCGVTQKDENGVCSALP